MTWLGKRAFTEAGARNSKKDKSAIDQIIDAAFGNLNSTDQEATVKRLTGLIRGRMNKGNRK